MSPSDADGQYGPITANAVARYKSDNGITPSDGVVGQQTMSSLDEYFYMQSNPAPIPAPIQPSEPISESIPPPPPDPTPEEGKPDGIGPYNSQPAGVLDQIEKQALVAIAATSSVALPNAGKNLKHYLDNTGDDLIVNPENIMNDIPDLRSLVKILAKKCAVEAYNSIGEESGSKAFSSKWEQHYPTRLSDWFFALGGYSYSVTGVVTKSATGGLLQYQVHIFDRYNWDTRKLFVPTHRHDPRSSIITTVVWTATF